MSDHLWIALLTAGALAGCGASEASEAGQLEASLRAAQRTVQFDQPPPGARSLQSVVSKCESDWLDGDREPELTVEYRLPNGDEPKAWFNQIFFDAGWAVTDDGFGFTAVVDGISLVAYGTMYSPPPHWTYVVAVSGISGAC